MKSGDVDVLARRFAEFLNGQAPPLQPADLSAFAFSAKDNGFAGCLIFAAGWYRGQEGASLLVPLLLDGAMREGAVPKRWRHLIDAVQDDLALDQTGVEAADLIARFLAEYDSAVLADAITMLRRVHADGGGRLPHHGRHLTGLLFALWLRWQDGASEADLEEVVRIGTQEAERLTPESADLYGAAVRVLSYQNTSGHDIAAVGDDSGISVQAYRATRLEVAWELRDARAASYERTGGDAHLDEAIRLGAVALEFAGGNDRAELLSAHAKALAARFRRSRTPADRDAAIKARRRERIEHSAEQETWFHATGELRALLSVRYLADRTAADLNSLIDLGAELLQDPRTDPQRRIGLLRGQVELLWERSNLELQAQDLERAVAAGRELAELIGDRDPAAFSTLCALLHQRFLQSEDLEDLRLAIDLGRRATAGHAGEQVLHLGNLFNALIRYAEETGSVADFDAAVDVAQAAADLCPEGDPERAPHLAAVAGARYGRFQVSGSEEDLAVGIRFGYAAMASAQGQDQEFHCAAVLMAGLTLRLDRFDDLAALEEALEVLRLGWCADPGWLQSLQALVHTVRGRARDLGIDSRILENLLPEYERGLFVASMEMAGAGAQTKDVGVLDLAFELLATAEDLGGPDRAGLYRGPRAQILLRRWQITGRRDELDAAVDGLIAAGTGLGAQMPWLAGANLRDAAIALFRRFRRRRDIADLEEAARHAERALELFGDDPQERARLTEFLADTLRFLDKAPMVFVQSSVGEADREGLSSHLQMATVLAWNEGRPRASGLSWVSAEQDEPALAEADPGSPRVLFLRTFTGSDASHVVLNSVAMALDGTAGRIEIVGDMRDRSAIEHSWAAAFGDRSPAERIDFVTSTEEGWRKEVLRRIRSVDVVIFYVSPKDAEFPEFRFGPAHSYLGGEDFWDRFMDEPLSRPITGPGLLREVSYVNRMGRLPITILICDDVHQPTLNDVIALAGVMGDATDTAGNFITPRLTAIDKQMGHLAKAYRGITYRPVEGASLLPDLSGAVRRALADLRAAGAAPDAQPWKLDDLWGRSPHARLLPPDNSPKIIAFSDVETVLFLPGGEITEVDPREMQILLSRESVERGCPYCRAPLDQMFFCADGLWTADLSDRIPTAHIRAVCQICGRRSTREGEILMPQ